MCNSFHLFCRPRIKPEAAEIADLNQNGMIKQLLRDDVTQKFKSM